MHTFSSLRLRPLRTERFTCCIAKPVTRSNGTLSGKSFAVFFLGRPRSSAAILMAVGHGSRCGGRMTVRSGERVGLHRIGRVGGARPRGLASDAMFPRHSVSTLALVVLQLALPACGEYPGAAAEVQTHCSPGRMR